MPAAFEVGPANAHVGDVAVDREKNIIYYSDMPMGVPAGTTLIVQAWIADAAAPKGLSSSDALEGETP